MASRKKAKRAEPQVLKMKDWTKELRNSMKPVDDYVRNGPGTLEQRVMDVYTLVARTLSKAVKAVEMK